MKDEVDFGLLAHLQERRSFGNGEVIFETGTAADEMYVVRRGAVEIRTDDRTLETVEANGIFGEMALIDGEARSATAVAKGDVELIPLNERQFLFLVGETPFFALNVLRTMAKRLRTANAR